jgi:hypothetical protein
VVPGMLIEGWVLSVTDMIDSFEVGCDVVLPS